MSQIAEGSEGTEEWIPRVVLLVPLLMIPKSPFCCPELISSKAILASVILGMLVLWACSSTLGTALELRAFEIRG